MVLSMKKKLNFVLFLIHYIFCYSWFAAARIWSSRQRTKRRWQSRSATDSYPGRPTDGATSHRPHITVAPLCGQSRNYKTPNMETDDCRRSVRARVCGHRVDERPRRADVSDERLRSAVRHARRGYPRLVVWWRGRDQLRPDRTMCRRRGTSVQAEKRPATRFGPGKNLHCRSINRGLSMS